MSLGGPRREALFQEFLTGLDQAKERELASEIRNGQIRRNSQRLMLQAASLLRQTGRDYVQGQAEVLLTTITRTDMIYNTIEAGGFLEGRLQ